VKVDARNSSGTLPVSEDGAWCAEEGDEVALSAAGPHPSTAVLSGAHLAPSSVRRDGALIITRWIIPIHTWAGRAELVIDDGNEVITRALDVSPHPGKLGVTAFREMIDELVEVSRGLPWGLSPGSLGGERDDDAPAVVHPAVLEAELPLLLRALRQLRGEALTCTTRTREVLPLRHARHVDPRSLRWLSTKPYAMLAVTRPDVAQVDAAPLVEQRRTERSYAHPATAHLRFLVDRLLRALRRSEDLLAAAGASSSPDAEHARWLRQRVSAGRLQLEAERDGGPLGLVAPAPATEGAAQAVVDHPVYARVQRTARRLLDPGMRVSSEGALRSPSRRTHELYELLALYRLVAAARGVLGVAWAWKMPVVGRHGPLDGLQNDATFSAAGPEGMRVEIRYQPTFQAYRAAAEQHVTHSITGERRPDVVLGLFQGKELVRWVGVDAKYRSSRPAIHEGLADAHVYQDALRWNGRRAAATYIAVPACKSDAAVYATRAYVDDHRFGMIITGEPDCFASMMRQLLGQPPC
jgi:hypothetical protein